MSEKNAQVLQRQEGCPEGCCTGTEILCISIPCPVNIVLLGLTLNLELPCLRLTSGQSLTGTQISQILQVLVETLGNLGSVIGQQQTAAQE